jgi:hypothetical protein
MSDNKEKHLCKLVKKDYLKENLPDYIELIKNPKYICKKCGRVAVDKHYICKPVEMKKG